MEPQFWSSGRKNIETKQTDVHDASQALCLTFPIAEQIAAELSYLEEVDSMTAEAGAHWHLPLRILFGIFHWCLCAGKSIASTRLDKDAILVLAG